MSVKFDAIQSASANREHGTRARYIGARCRCLLCRAANSRYNSERDRARREFGDKRDIVSTSEARKHIKMLARKGMGYKLVAESAKVAVSIVQKVRTGERKRIRANTERAILAVKYELAQLGDASLVESGPTWKLLDELIEAGYTRTQLAAWLGHKANPPSIQFKRGKAITARCAAKVLRMYEAIKTGKLRRA